MVTNRGYALRKSRRRKHWGLDDQGGYRIVDPDHNLILFGERFDLTLDGVERLLNA